jgi:broad specificity phosphatase PhoE
VTAVYSSPVERCVETAQYIADQLQLPIICREDLGEVRYGDWEGKKIRKLVREPRWQVVQFFPSRMTFPSGEALREVQFRAVRTLEQLSVQHETETVVVVSHADVIKLVLAHYIGVHIDLFQRIAVSPASVSVLHLSPAGYVRVMRVNDDGPLQPFSAAPKQSKTKKK